MFKPNYLPINTALAFTLADNRNPNLIKTDLTQTVNFATLPGMTIWMDSRVGLTQSSGLIDAIINRAPNKIRLFNAAGARPITSSVGFGINVPYFTGSDAAAKYFLDDNGAGGALTLTSSISSSGEWHCFAAIYLHQTGSNGTSVNQHSIFGDSNGFMDVASFEASGARITSNDGAAKMTQYIPYSIDTKYILESKVVSGMMSLSFNGGPPFGTGTVGTLNAGAVNIAYFIGSSRGLAGTSLEGEIAEFIMLSKSLDSFSASLVRKQMGNNWGINTL